MFACFTAFRTMPNSQSYNHHQFDKSNNSILRDFSCENDNSSWTEDNINVYESNNVTIQRGLVDGNNSPSGDGVMFECGNKAHAYMDAGLVEDVDTINQVYDIYIYIYNISA